MDNSPELTAVDLNAPYKKLLEYNDVLLAGTEHSNGSFEFVTWDCKNNSLLNVIAETMTEDEFLNSEEHCYEISE